MKSLQTICAQNIADVNLVSTSKCIEGLPRTILPILLPYLSASGLHQLQALFDKEGISTEETWRKQLESRWGTGKTAYKVTDVFGSVYCSLHQYYMSKHVMDLLSFFIHRNPIDPKHIFTTRLDKIPILRIRRSADDVDESHLLVRSSMEDLYHYAKHAYTFHLYSQAQVTFLTENWKIVENLAQGVIKLIIHNAVDKGYEKWRGIVNFFIECGSVDHVVVIFPRLTILNLRNLIFCCAGVHSVPDNSAIQQQSPNMNTECTLSSSSDCWQEPGASFSATLNHSANLKHSGLTMMSNSAESTTSDETFLTDSPTCTSFQCNGVDAGHTCRTSLVPDDSELKKLQHDPSANASSYSVNLSLDDLSESAVDQCRTTTVEAIGIKRKLNSDLASDESFSEAKVSRLNSSDDITSPDEMTQDLFDEALMLPVVSPEKPSLSSKQAEKFGIESIAGVEHKNLESRATTSDICDLSNYANFSSSGSLDCDQLTWHGRGVKKFVLSHSFFYDDDSEVDAVAMILCEVLQHWKDLEQFAMMHVYTETDKLEKCYVQLLEVLKRLVLNGQLTNLVLRDTKMPCDQYQLPLQFKRANVETEPLKRLDISNVRYSQGDLDKLVGEGEFRNLDKSGADYSGTHHLNLVDFRTNWDETFMAHLLLVLKHDQGLRRLTWHNAHKILNEEFTSAMETLADVNRLEYLEIKFLLISCKEREEALIKVISNATNLRVLNLSDCDLQHQLVLSDGFIEALASSNIRELCLSENKLGNKVLTAITRVLKAQQPNIKLTSIDISENCIDVDGLLEFAESLGTVMSNHSHSTILRKLTADYNVRSCEEQEIVLKVFSALVREISVKVISNYSNFAEFEAQM